MSIEDTYEKNSVGEKRCEIRIGDEYTGMIRGKKMLLVAAGIAYCAFLAGCENAADMEVRIMDGQVETRMQAASGLTVQEILNEAEITLDAKDQIIPDTAQVITGDGADIEIKRYAKVDVKVEDTDPVCVELTGATVGEALEQAGVKLSDHDYVNHDMSAYLSDGMDIDVTRRLEVTLTADGKKQTLLTEAKTVDEFLAEQELSLSEFDRITPKQADALKEGTSIIIKRVEKKELTEKEAVDFETVTTYSNSMTQGTSKVTKQGVNGEKDVTYEVTYVDGKEESREMISETITKEPVNQEVVMGSKPKGKQVVSKQAIYDCDGSGHGYYIITYSDGSVVYKDF